MPTVRFPGPDAPAVPPFEISVPDDWHPFVLQEAALAAAGAEAGGFRTNVTVDAQRVAPATSPTALAERLLSELRSSWPDLKLAGSWDGDIAGVPAHWSEYAFTDARAGPIYQLEVVMVVPSSSPEVSHVFQVHASCAGSHAAELLPGIREIVKSFRLAP